MSDPTSSERHEDAILTDTRHGVDNGIFQNESASGIDGSDNTTGNALSGNSAWSWPSDLPEHPGLLPTPTTIAPVQMQRQFQPQPPPSATTVNPHYHRQLPPLNHSNPIASLTAALRGEQYTPQPLRPTHQVPQLDQSTHATPLDQHNHSVTTTPTLNTSNHQATSNNPSSSRRPAIPSPHISLSASDSTDSPDTMPGTSTTNARKRSRESQPVDLDASPRPKRQRHSNLHFAQVDLSLSDDAETPASERAETPTAEQTVLDREREDFIERQKEESGRPTRLNDLTCMICLEHFTNMSVTHCGHIFCHECLTQALNASERNSERNVGTCPACRKVIKRNTSAKNQIIPLALMKRQPRSDKTAKYGARRSSKTSTGHKDSPIDLNYL